MDARVAALVLAAAVALAGCGGGGEGEEEAGLGGPLLKQPQTDGEPSPRFRRQPRQARTVPPGGTATLTADPGGRLEFSATRFRAKPGKLSLVMYNHGVVPHAIAVRGPRFPSTARKIRREGHVVQAGGSSTVTVELKPSTWYEFYCPVPGHEDGGMKGIVTVE